MKATITVTADDIKRARDYEKMYMIKDEDGKLVRRSTHCPVALAARRAFPKQHVSVDRGGICVTDEKGREHIYPLPTAGSAIVDWFDSFSKTDPPLATFEVDLEYPDDQV